MMRFIRSLGTVRHPGKRNPTGVPGRALAVLAFAVVGTSLAGCYSFSGGGGIPSHLRTVYVAPIENRSTQFGLSESLGEQLLVAARQRLGLRLASEGEADTVIQASIQSYSDQAVNFDAVDGVGANVFQRRVSVSVSVDIIDVANNVVIWSNSGLSGVGEYSPESQSEEEALLVAIENLVQQVVDGAQSQW